MKSNRKIQGFADKSLSGLYNETFAAELSQKRAEIEQKELKTHANAQNKTTARKWAFSAVGCLLILIAIIVPCVLVLVPGETGEIPAPPSYGWDDEINTAANIDEVNSVLEAYKFVEEYIQMVSLVVDGKSGDELYYDISWEDFEGMQGCRIMVIVNPYYEPLEMPTNHTMTVSDLQIKYTIETEFDEEYDVYAFEGYGETEINGIRILFRNYYHFSELNDNGFANFLESIFSVV